MSATLSSRPRRPRAWLPPTFTLALWQLREVWQLLVIMTGAITLAVTLVCAVPTFSQIALASGLHSLLDALAQNTTFRVEGEVTSPAHYVEGRQQVEAAIQSTVGPYLLPDQHLFLQAPGMAILVPGADGSSAIRTPNSIGLVGIDVASAMTHLDVVQGRLPSDNSAVPEIVVTTPTANMLGLTVGSTVTSAILDNNGGVLTIVHLSVVGIVDLPTSTDPFWYGTDFRAQPQNDGYFFPAMISSPSLMGIFTMLAVTTGGRQGTNPQAEWIYHLDPAKVTVDRLDDLVARLNTLQTTLPDMFDVGAALPIHDVSGAPVGPDGVLATYADRSVAPQIPVGVFLVEVAGLVLFFVTMLGDLIIERQTDAIATLRSRGMTRAQILGALGVQSFGVGAIALIAGPLLMVPVVVALATHLLPASESGSFAAFITAPFATAWGVRWYALLTVFTMLAAIMVSIWRATRLNVLTLRREGSRSTSRPLWLRLHLDLAAAVIALAGYLFFVALAHTTVLDPETTAELVPLALIAPLFFLLACALFFLRLAPALLRGGLWLAARQHGAAAMVALAQIARAPQHAIRMISLLALAIALAIFTLTFGASQTQRNVDVATYQTVADFSGYLPIPVGKPLTSAEQSAQYDTLSGVATTSLGYMLTTFASPPNTNVQVMAVDATTFAATSRWSLGPGSPTLGALMTSLGSEDARTAVANGGDLPVVADATLWQALDLGHHPRFSLPAPGYGSNRSLHFRAIAEINNLPPLADSSAAATTTNGFAARGILVDYQSLTTAYQTLVGNTLAPNYIWLRAQNTSGALAAVRTELSQGDLALSDLNDRAATVTTLQHDPFYLDLTGVLNIGAVATLLLATLGDLIASWLYTRRRLTQFAVLRALGSAPRQIASIFLWEQGLVFLCALALGGILGGALTATAIPALIFTGSAGQQASAGTEEFFARQHVPPVQTIVPPSLSIALTLLVVTCAVVIVMMTRTVARPSISQTLRLNED